MAGRVDTGGLATALQLLGAGGEAVPGTDGQQDDLFEADAPLPLLPAATPERTGKAGRPAGARNKSTEEWVRYFLGRYRSPLTALGELYSRPLGDLVDELQAIADRHARLGPGAGEGVVVGVARISPLEVLKMQRDAAAALLPYIHRKQPMAVEFEQRQRAIVVMDLSAGDVADAGRDELDMSLGQPQQNQGVIDVTPAPVGCNQSDGPEKA